MPKETEENLKKLKEEYKKLQQKYSLPDFDELDKEFELRKIETGQFLIKEVRRIMLQRIDSIIAVLEPIMDPGPSVHSAVEAKIFEKHNLEGIFLFYKKLWHIIHKGISASYVSEDAEASFISEAWKAWPEIKKKAADYTKQIADGWAKIEKDVIADKYLQ